MKFRDYIKEDYFEVAVAIGTTDQVNTEIHTFPDAKNKKQAKKQAEYQFNKDYGRGKYEIIRISREKGNPGTYQGRQEKKKSRYDVAWESVSEGAVLDAIKEFVIVAHMSIRAAQMSVTKDSGKVKKKMVRLIDTANKIAPTFEDAKERASFFKKINKDIDKGVRGPELVKRMRFHLGDLSKEKSTGKFMDDLEKQMATWKAEE